jgi:predicted PurR-regulated permease PerM/GAF domain-containing protein
MPHHPPEPAAPAPVAQAQPAGAQRFFYGGAALALGIAALVIGKDLLMPLAFAALLAFVLDPLVERLRRWRVPQAVAVALVIVLALAVLSATAALVGQQVLAVGRDLPTYQNTIQKKLKDLRGLTRHNPVADASRMLGIAEEEPSRAARPAPEAPPSPLRALGDWAEPVLVPLATTGFVIVLVAYLLAQRRELRDRLVRLTGGDIHHMAEVLDDAARRVSRYLGAQLLVNIGYGAPMALGLWWIGVPGALLWGLLAALLRFVPYLGPAIGALFPLTMAFAVDPGWSMVLWTLGLVLTLELISNNIVEPLAYGTSTGVSPVAVLVSAAFWGLVWGPVGLVLATPLTVCLVVMGQHLGPLRFLHVMLGSGPVFDRPTQLYQRLISGDHEEAVASCRDEAAASPAGFYDRTAVPMLALAAAAHNASPEQRHRVLAGTTRLVQALTDRHTADAAPTGPRVLCVGARNELDGLSAQMLAHALQLQGQAAEALSAVHVSPERLGTLDLHGVGSVVLCTFNEQPQAQARLLARRLRRRCPGLRVVLAAWRADAELRWPGAVQALGIDALATSLLEAAGRAPADEPAGGRAPVPPAPPTAPPPATPPEHAVREQLARGAQRAVEVFGTPMASVCWRGASGTLLQAGAGHSSWALGGTTPSALPGTPLAWVLEQGQALVLPDVARDARFAGAPQPGLEAGGALAAVPLRDTHGQPQGVLALHDTQVRHFGRDEQRLLEAMATELAAALDVETQAEPARQDEARRQLAGPASSVPSYSSERPAPAGGAACAA